MDVEICKVGTLAEQTKSLTHFKSVGNRGFFVGKADRCDVLTVVRPNVGEESAEALKICEFRGKNAKEDGHSLMIDRFRYHPQLLKRNSMVDSGGTARLP